MGLEWNIILNKYQKYFQFPLYFSLSILQFKGLVLFSKKRGYKISSYFFETFYASPLMTSMPYNQILKICNIKCARPNPSWNQWGGKLAVVLTKVVVESLLYTICKIKQNMWIQKWWKWLRKKSSKESLFFPHF